MKKKTLILLSAILATTFIGCGQIGNKNIAKDLLNSSSSEESETSIEDESKESESEVEEASKEEMEESAPDEEEVIAVPTEEPQEDIDTSGMTEAQRFVSNISVGWNLGNTLDAHGRGNTLNSETYWGNPKTTKAMIDEVSRAGFNTIRIPVTFAEHLGSAPDYLIDGAWLDRVQETVNYAIDNDMYVILDTHHETDYWLIPTKENEESITEELTAIWLQLSERFKDYDEKLIFEGMNEPRVEGSAMEWNGGTPAEREVVNNMNQAFVDTVRRTGGNNANRYLIVCTYGHSGVEEAVRDLVIPDDEHIIAAVHIYAPYEFCFEQGRNYSNWDGSELNAIQYHVNELKKKFYDQGIPVIVTEFGACNKNNEEEVLKWLHDYMGEMKKYGFKLVWWDNGNYNSQGEKFAIFNRKNLSWYSEAIKDMLINES
ncbi:MAG: glycoside hydrolase family 5 protein [Lachnospiraceae bacterium]|nr:glycoside hydrolase family 5 protein [Lachnospiraceae bacterium]